MSARKPPPDPGPAIDRLRQLAAEAGDHLLLADGPPHPDAKLLDLCAEALHHLRAGEKAYASRTSTVRAAYGGEWTEQDRSDDARLLRLYNDGMTRAKPPLRLIAKLPATTAAGIYAKAMVVRASSTGAASLAKTLADDLIGNPVLRASLWAADAGQEAAEPPCNVVALPIGGRARKAMPGAVSLMDGPEAAP